MKTQWTWMAGALLIGFGLVLCTNAKTWSEGSKVINGWIPNTLYVPTPDPRVMDFFTGTGGVCIFSGILLISVRVFTWIRCPAKKD
jgi:uncharacterized membrane protein YedE/YeeE